MRTVFLALVVALSACAPFHYYPLPVSSGEARATFAPITVAANEMGLRYWKWDDSVGVQVDPEIRLSYMFDASNDYVLCVQLKHKDPPGGVQAALAKGKQIGDEIWRRAMALRPALPVQVMMPLAQPDVQPGVQVNIGR
jgi:hypothetical protein